MGKKSEKLRGDTDFNEETGAELTAMTEGMKNVEEKVDNALLINSNRSMSEEENAEEESEMAKCSTGHRESEGNGSLQIEGDGVLDSTQTHSKGKFEKKNKRKKSHKHEGLDVPEGEGEASPEQRTEGNAALDSFQIPSAGILGRNGNPSQILNQDGLAVSEGLASLEQETLQVGGNEVQDSTQSPSKGKSGKKKKRKKTHKHEGLDEASLRQTEANAALDSCQIYSAGIIGRNENPSQSQDHEGLAVSEGVASLEQETLQIGGSGALESSQSPTSGKSVKKKTRKKTHKHESLGVTAGDTDQETSQIEQNGVFDSIPSDEKSERKKRKKSQRILGLDVPEDDSHSDQDWPRRKRRKMDAEIIRNESGNVAVGEVHIADENLRSRKRRQTLEEPNDIADGDRTAQKHAVNEITEKKTKKKNKKYQKGSNQESGRLKNYTVAEDGIDGNDEDNSLPAESYPMQMADCAMLEALDELQGEETGTQQVPRSGRLKKKKKKHDSDISDHGSLDANGGIVMHELKGDETGEEIGPQNTACVETLKKKRKKKHRRSNEQDATDNHWNEEDNVASKINSDVMAVATDEESEPGRANEVLPADNVSRETSGGEVKKDKKEKRKVRFQEPDSYWRDNITDDNSDTTASSQDDHEQIVELSEGPLAQGRGWRADRKRDDLIYGYFSEKEDDKLKSAVFKYLKIKNWDKVQGLEKLLHPKLYPEARGAWVEIAKSLPHRPIKMVNARARRILGDFKRGRWSKAELEKLKEAHAEFGNNWIKVESVLGRYAQDCRDKWRVLSQASTLKSGGWTFDELNNLCKLVRLSMKLRDSSEKELPDHRMVRDNINWEVIGEKMRRTSSRCSVIWYRNLASSLVSDGKWANEDDRRLLESTKKLHFKSDLCVASLMRTGASSEEEIDWESLLPERDGDICERRWHQMIRLLPEQAEPFQDRVEHLIERYAPDLIGIEEKFDEDGGEVNDSLVT